MSKTENLLIRSIDRIRGDSNNFEIKLPDVLNNISSIALLNIHMPNTIYNIRSDNYRLGFFDGSENVLTLSYGAYNIITLKNALETAMNSVGTQVYTFVYNPTTMKITISAPGPFIIRGSITNSLNYILGHDTDNDTSSSSTQISPYVCRLDLPLNLVISILELNRAFSRTTSDIHGNFIISTSGNTQDTMIWNRGANYPINNSYQSSGLTTLTITVKRSDGRIVDLNGGDWEMLLYFCYC